MKYSNMSPSLKANIFTELKARRHGRHESFVCSVAMATSKCQSFPLGTALAMLNQPHLAPVSTS